MGIAVVRRSPGFGSPPRAWGQCGMLVDATEQQLVHPHVRGDNGSP